MIDQRFSILSDVFVDMISNDEISKKRFILYKDALQKQSNGEFLLSFNNYFKSLQIEKNSIARSFIFLNIGILYFQLNQKYRALLYFHACLELNPMNCNAINYIAIIYNSIGNQLLEKNLIDQSDLFFQRSIQYWKIAFKLAPRQYLEAQNWVKTQS